MLEENANAIDGIRINERTPLLILYLRSVENIISKMKQPRSKCFF